MTDQNLNATTAVSQLLSPSVLAALRNVLSGVGGVLAMLGIVALSPTQVDKIISIAQGLGVVLGAVVALVGLVTPLISGAIAGWKASQPQQVKAVAAIAQDPTQAQSAPAQQALVKATAAIASNRVLEKSDEAKQTLIAATVGLDEVQGIVADKAMADSIPMASVMSSDSVKIISNDSGLDTNRGQQ